MAAMKSCNASSFPTTGLSWDSGLQESVKRLRFGPWPKGFTPTSGSQSEAVRLPGQRGYGSPMGRNGKITIFQLAVTQKMFKVWLTMKNPGKEWPCRVTWSVFATCRAGCSSLSEGHEKRRSLCYLAAFWAHSAEGAGISDVHRLCFRFRLLRSSKALAEISPASSGAVCHRFLLEHVFFKHLTSK